MKKDYAILQIDPYLRPYQADIALRMQNYADMKKRLLGPGQRLSDFANGHLYFGFHRTEEGWIYREWAPNAQEMALTGDFNQWNRTSHKLKEISKGVWEIFLRGADTLTHGDKVKVVIKADGQYFDRIPLYCKRVMQEPGNHMFNGQIWEPEQPFAWTDQSFHMRDSNPLLIYESHVGMAGLKAGVSTFNDFTAFVLPRVQKLGYNAIQLMAIAEHPYYGSFGYQVSNFFAVSSRFGTPEDLKKLIDTAHQMGIGVLLDLVHSHAAPNVLDGLGAFDGTDYQFFHKGAQGSHPAWGTKLFDYGKPGVLHFLLSNIKLWLEEYHFDGFRFDGVTSMLYHDHGMGDAFDGYQKYFSFNTDTEAVTYLQLATELSKEVDPQCVLIAEDMSGMPGMCLPISWGGIGFDYRLAMGMPDFWVRTLRDRRDEDWDLGTLWHELTQRRPGEKVIGYCESHDQALVGDKTIMFWLADQEMYWHMHRDSQNDRIERAMALHKMIRLITCTCSGEGYLNFMGNEFGHPEWIDFPRQGNGWCYDYARRRWDLADDENLRYQYLQNFDRAMLCLVKQNLLLYKETKLLLHDEGNKILIYRKGRHLLAFNFHPAKDYVAELLLDAQAAYKIVLNSDWETFGGKTAGKQCENIAAQKLGSRFMMRIPLASRTAAVYEEVPMDTD